MNIDLRQEFEVGKVYQHKDGGLIIQIIRYLDNDQIEICAFFSGSPPMLCRLPRTSFAANWIDRKSLLPNHPGVGQPCSDCHEFCRQQCRTPKVLLKKTEQEIRKALEQALPSTPAQAMDGLINILFKDLKAKINE